MSRCSIPITNTCALQLVPVKTSTRIPKRHYQANLDKGCSPQEPGPVVPHHSICSNTNKGLADCRQLNHMSRASRMKAM